MFVNLAGVVYWMIHIRLKLSSVIDVLIAYLNSASVSF